MSDELSRTMLPPRSSRLVTTAICFTAVIATAVTTKIAIGSNEPAATPTPAPAPKPIVVPIPAPQLIVVQAPAPPPPAPPPIPAPVPRAITPTIEASCVYTTSSEDDPRPDCSWDTGFPAISADGTTIATEYRPLDDGRGNPGLIIHFVDVATSRVTRYINVLTPDAYVPFGDPKHAAMDAGIERETARAQRLLDAGGYRSMSRVGDMSSQDAEAVDGIKAEYAADTVRVVDVAAARSLWRRRFVISREFPKDDLDAETCSVRGVQNIATAWDARSRTIIASVTYRQGPEFCGDVRVEYAHRVRP